MQYDLILLIIVEGSLEVKLPTIWTDEKPEVGRVRQEKRRSEKIREEEGEKKEDAGARKGRKVAIHCVFSNDLWLRRVEKQARYSGGCGASWPDERWKSARCVARSTFPSQIVQNTPGSEHFRELRCRKSARRCGAKNISKSNCTKHTRIGALLDVEMWKKCTPLWCEAHFKVKSIKKWWFQIIFGSGDVEKVHAVVVRSRFRSHNVKAPHARMSKKCTPLWREDPHLLTLFFGGGPLYVTYIFWGGVGGQNM